MKTFSFWPLVAVILLSIIGIEAVPFNHQLLGPANGNERSIDILQYLRSGKLHGHHANKFLEFQQDQQHPLNIPIDARTEEFFEAAESGDVATIKRMIKEGFNVNKRDENGWTAIMSASLKAHVEVVKVLIAAGAEVNAKEKYLRMNSLMISAYNGHIEVVKVLIQAGADVNASAIWGWTALIMAASKGEVETVEVLITAGAVVNATDYAGKTALMWTAESGSVGCVKALIAAKADLNKKDITGKTALMYAKRKGHSEIVEILRAAGAKE